MSMRDALDISSYLVIGPENTGGRTVGDVISAALAAGFTCVQVRSKVWETGRKDRNTSSCVGTTRPRTAFTSLITLRWLSITPFGLPVVPLV